MVSGGADSVAMLRLALELHDRYELRVVHVNHQTRGAESDSDEAFVRELSSAHRLPCDVFHADRLPPQPPTEAGWRAIRRSAMDEVTRIHPGIVLALGHTLDDCIETMVMRLLRGGEPWSIAVPRSLSLQSNHRLLLRPMITARREAVRVWLRHLGQPWREDSSNCSSDFLRNRVRAWLAGRPNLWDVLAEVLGSADTLFDAVVAAAHDVDETDTGSIAKAPPPAARMKLRAWLWRSGIADDRLSARMLDRVIATASDRAMPSRLSMPGGGTLRRKGTRLLLDQPPDSRSSNSTS
jgi:tRNA(Ile)-lysidine synthetase-like protein